MGDSEAKVIDIEVYLKALFINMLRIHGHACKIVYVVQVIVTSAFEMG